MTTMEKNTEAPEITLDEWGKRRHLNLYELDSEVKASVQDYLDAYNEQRGDGQFYVIMEYRTFLWDELPELDVMVNSENFSDEEYDELQPSAILHASFS